MKDWSVSLGQSGTNLCCCEGPWWSFFLNWIVEARCCTTLFKWKGKKYNFHDIPLPTWITWKDEDFGETNLDEYLGDFGNVIHQYIIWPIQQWCWSKRRSDWMVPVPWTLLKPHQPEDTVKWVEETITEWAKDDAEREAKDRDLATAAAGDSNPGSDSIQSEVRS